MNLLRNYERLSRGTPNILLRAGWRRNSHRSIYLPRTADPHVSDFLPRPEDLVFRDTQYQRMIRRLLDAYAEHHSRLTGRGDR